MLLFPGKKEGFNLQAVLFDLDGTLLNLDIDEFFPRYLKKLSQKLSHLMEPEKFIDHLMVATRAMLENTDPGKTNQDVFMETFFAPGELKVEEFFPQFEKFYARDFPLLNNGYGPVPGAHEALKVSRERGLKIVLATNPLFPKEAVLERMRWANIQDQPFDLISSYEHMHFCKPNPQYFEEVLSRLNLVPEETLMVGNDPLEDMIAGKLGIKTFLAEDYLVERQESIPPDFRGQLREVVPIIKEL